MAEPQDTTAHRMWLLPVISRVASVAVRTFYQFSVDGEDPPAAGPALFVANHPNSLVDPAFVAAAARRPVRFLAKAPLFTDRFVGWLVRAAGAIPVYRRKDDPGLMERNVSTFSAVHEALEAGAAVGIFPEGISHSAPALAELRTGAARIALGAAERIGRNFPIVPVGMVLREKGRFRSRGTAIVGKAVDWADLRGRPETDADAVRDLTGRIESALRGVTVNVDRWEDVPTIECAEALYAAELRLDRSAEDRVRRMREVSETLARYRRSDAGRVESLYGAIERFRQSLATLGLEPDDLDALPDAMEATGWFARRLVLFAAGGPLAAAGALVFFLPYRLTDRIGHRSDLTPDVKSTWKILGGIVLYVGWIVMLVVIAGLWLGFPAALALLVGLPLLGLATTGVRDSWVDARDDLRRYRAMLGGGDELERLREHRRVLAEALELMRQGGD